MHALLLEQVPVTSWADVDAVIDAPPERVPPPAGRGRVVAPPGTAPLVGLMQSGMRSGGAIRR